MERKKKHTFEEQIFKTFLGLHNLQYMGWENRTNGMPIVRLILTK